MNAKARPFKTSVLQDGMTLMWQGRAVIAIAMLLTILLSGLSAAFPGPALLGDDGAPSLPGTIWQVILIILHAVPLIPVAYVSHIAVLRGVAGIAALRSDGWGGILRFGRAMLVAVFALAILATLYQLIFVSDILLMTAGRLDTDSSLRLVFGAVMAIAALAAFVLLGSWGAVSIQRGQVVFGAVLQVGRQSLWYALLRVMTVILFLPILSALGLPLMGQVVAILVALGVAADPAFLIVSAGFSALIACFAVVLVAVIFCRVWLKSEKI